MSRYKLRYWFLEGDRSYFTIKFPSYQAHPQSCPLKEEAVDSSLVWKIRSSAQNSAV